MLLEALKTSVILKPDIKAGRSDSPKSSPAAHKEGSNFALLP